MPCRAIESQPFLEFVQAGECDGIGEDVGIRSIGTAAQRVEFADRVVRIVVDPLLTHSFRVRPSPSLRAGDRLRLRAALGLPLVDQ